jgi:hypothetical protein
VIPGQTVCDYSVRICHDPPHDEHVRFQARVAVLPGAKPDSWEALRDALNEALPPGRRHKQDLEPCRWRLRRGQPGASALTTPLQSPTIRARNPMRLGTWPTQYFWANIQ